MLEETPPLLLAATLLLAVMAALVTGQADDKCACGPVKDSSGSQRIVGGDTVGDYDYPWMARLVGATPLPGGCGGSLISQKHVLTAAHCIHPEDVKFFQPTITTKAQFIEQARVIVGEHSMKKYIDNEKTGAGNWKTNEAYKDNVRSIQNIAWHKDYRNPITNTRGEFDYGIITLQNSVTFNEKVAPICLPATMDSKKYENKKATFTGWGLMNGTLVTAEPLVQATVQSEELKFMDLTVSANQNMSRYLVYHSYFSSLLFVCESTSISLNVRYLVSQSVSLFVSSSTNAKW